MSQESMHTVARLLRHLAHDNGCAAKGQLRQAALSSPHMRHTSGITIQWNLQRALSSLATQGLAFALIGHAGKACVLCARLVQYVCTASCVTVRRRRRRRSLSTVPQCLRTLPNADMALRRQAAPNAAAAHPAAACGHRASRQHETAGSPARRRGVGDQGQLRVEDATGPATCPVDGVLQRPCWLWCGLQCGAEHPGLMELRAGRRRCP